MTRFSSFFRTASFTFLVALVVPLHPLHLLLNKYHTDISALPGHDGYASPVGAADVGHYREWVATTPADPITFLCILPHQPDHQVAGLWCGASWHVPRQGGVAARE